MIDISKLSKLAEMNITPAQKKMLEEYIPQAITLCDKLSFVNTENIEDKTVAISYDQLRPDTPAAYDQLSALEIIVPRMVNKD